MKAPETKYRLWNTFYCDIYKRLMNVIRNVCAVFVVYEINYNEPPSVYNIENCKNNSEHYFSACKVGWNFP
jgi:hypothetical protein